MEVDLYLSNMHDGFVKEGIATEVPNPLSL